MPRNQFEGNPLLRKDRTTDEEKEIEAVYKQSEKLTEKELQEWNFLQLSWAEHCVQRALAEEGIDFESLSEDVRVELLEQRLDQVSWWFRTNVMLKNKDIGERLDRWESEAESVFEELDSLGAPAAAPQFPTVH